MTPPRSSPEPPSHAPPAWMVDERNRTAAVAALGLVGGAAIAWWATEHMFVEGLEDKERRTLVGFGAAAVAVYAAFELFGLDKRWLDVQGAAEAVQEKWPSIVEAVKGSAK